MPLAKADIPEQYTDNTADLWAYILEKVDPTATPSSDYICNFPTYFYSLAYEVVQRFSPTFTTADFHNYFQDQYTEVVFSLLLEKYSLDGNPQDPATLRDSVPNLFQKRAYDYLFALALLYDPTLTQTDVETGEYKCIHDEILLKLADTIALGITARAFGIATLTATPLQTYLLQANVNATATVQAIVALVGTANAFGVTTLTTKATMTAFAYSYGIATVEATEQSFEAEYQAVLDYANTQGYTLPSEAQQILQNQLVADLKTAGIWSKLDSFGVFATNGDSDFALIDWIRLETKTAVNSPTFTEDTGFLSNGTTSYINTNLDLTTLANFTLNNNSFGVYTETSGSTSNALIGSNDTTQASILYMNVFAYNNMGLVGGNFSNSSPSSNGFIGSYRFNTATQHYRYVNGSAASKSENSLGITNRSPFICCRNNDGTPSNFSTRYIKAYWYGAYIDMASFNSVLDNYINSL